MHDKIILDANETIVCPKCSHEFTLGNGITRQTIDRHAEEFEALLTCLLPREAIDIRWGAPVPGEGRLLVACTKTMYSKLAACRA